MRGIQQVILFAGLISLQQAKADAPFVDGPGSVPTHFERRCASDLFKDGKVLNPDEACDLYIKSNNAYIAGGSKDPNLRFDLSRLEPDPTTTVINASMADKWMWRPPQDPFADVISYKSTNNPANATNSQASVGGFYDDLKAMDIKEEGDVVDYVSDTEASIGRHAIIVQKTNAKGQIKYFQLRMDLKGHNYLLRKTLLRKIGYSIPYMDRLKTVKVKFANESDLFDFVNSIYKKTFVEPSRWILNPYVDLLIESPDKQEDKDKIDELTQSLRDSLELTLQDVIVVDGMIDKTFNVARGRLSSAQIQGRRSLNALLVPFSLTDVPESANIFDWSMCDEFNDQLYLNYEFATNPDGQSLAFAPSYEDARWISRKILGLSRKDWQEVVYSAKAPAEVNSLLVEKLISRRNCLREKLHLNKESGHIDAINETSQELPVQFNISEGNRLKGGKLETRKELVKNSQNTNSDKSIIFDPAPESFWKGYARNWSGIEPDSPQSREELLGYAKTQLVANIIRNAVFRFNQKLPKTDIQKKEFDRDLDLSVWQFGQFLTTKEIPSIPRNIWSVKSYNLFAYPDRDVIAGNYIGAENQIQVADSLTLGASLGRHYRWEGLPAKMGISGDARLSLIKSWVHIKPIASMKAGLAEPFKNIMVPYFESRAGRPLEYILGMEDRLKKIKSDLLDLNKSIPDLQSKISAETDADKKKKLAADLDLLSQKQKDLQAARAQWKKDLNAKINEFNTDFGPNESVIVSTSIGPDVSLLLQKGVSEIASIYAQVRAKFVDLSRLHITRKGSNKLQIYFDPSLYSDISLALGLQAKGIPLVVFDWSFKNGATTTNFFEFDIDSSINQMTGELNNPNFFSSLRVMSAALRNAPLKYFKREKKPMIITHDFADKNFGLQVLARRYQSEHTKDCIKVSSPTAIQAVDKLGRPLFDDSGKAKMETVYRDANYLRITDGSRKGIDYQNLIVNITTGLLKEKYPDLQINVNTSGNPADTIGGKAISRHVIVESEVIDNRLRMDNLLASIRYTWKGWSIDKNGAEKTLDEIQKMFGESLIKKPDLTTTKKVQFYNLAMNISLYQQAINNLLSLSEKQVTEIFNDYFTGQVFVSGETGELDRGSVWANSVNNDLKIFRKNWQKNPEDAAKALTDILSVLQSKLDFQGLIKMCGGIQNIFVRGNFDGFRLGDEKGQHSLDSSTLGTIGSYEPGGPLANVLNKTGIANGELFISWLLSPL